MASASRILPKEEPVVQLNLTRAEVGALLAVTYSVGGHDQLTSRRHIDNIRKALEGLDMKDMPFRCDETTGTIHFIAKP